MECRVKGLSPAAEQAIDSNSNVACPAVSLCSSKWTPRPLARHAARLGALIRVRPRSRTSCRDALHCDSRDRPMRTPLPTWGGSHAINNRHRPKPRTPPPDPQPFTIGARHHLEHYAKVATGAARHGQNHRDGLGGDLVSVPRRRWRGVDVQRRSLAEHVTARRRTSTRSRAVPLGKTCLLISRRQSALDERSELARQPGRYESADRATGVAHSPTLPQTNETSTADRSTVPLSEGQARWIAARPTSPHSRSFTAVRLGSRRRPPIRPPRSRRPPRRNVVRSCPASRGRGW